MFLNTQSVCNRYEFSRSTLWRLCKAGHFPPPIKFSPGQTGIVRWKLEELEAWEKKGGVR